MRKTDTTITVKKTTYKAGSNKASVTERVKKVRRIQKWKVVCGTVRLGKDVARKLPTKLVKRFYKDGFVVKVVPTMTGVNHYGRLDFSRKVLKCAIPKDQYICHEMWHYLADITSYPDETAAWEEICKAEAKMWYDPNKAYDTSSTAEYFAAAYWQYVVNPKKLKRSCHRHILT